MLVLNRVESQGITVDGPCRVVVIGIKGRRVQLGIEAEKQTRIVRSELLKSEGDDDERVSD